MKILSPDGRLPGRSTPLLVGDVAGDAHSINDQRAR
jgi:hypothetical protein